MEKYLIEVPHGEDKASCKRAIQVFMSSGSHFVTNAEWGCMDGDHKAWLTVETPTKEDALRILPAAYKQNAKIVKLVKFRREDFELKNLMDHHA